MHIFDAVIFMHILDAVIFMHILNAFDIYQILYVNLIDRFTLVYIYPGTWGARAFVPQPGRCPGTGGTFFDFGSFFIRKMVRSSRWGDGSQQAGSNTAIESFWRCILVEIWLFLWSIRCPWRSPWGLRNVPGGSPKGPRGSPGGPWEASGAQGRSVRSLGSVSWARRYFFSSLKMSKNVKNRKKS